MDFSALFASHWQDLKQALLYHDPITVDGRRLSLGAVVAVARSTGPSITLDVTALASIPASAQLVISSVSRGQVVYGVNTGFGGNADTRVVFAAVEALQHALIRSKHCGILQARFESARTANSGNEGGNGEDKERHLQLAIPLDFPEAATCMPESWVRASMLIRLNSLVSGASGVKPATVERLAALLNNDIVPVMPLRGSISASGDLSPLSYIAGAMQGTPSLSVYAGSRSDGNRTCVRADKALADAGIAPLALGPKEGLAIINGTAVSAGVATLALHESVCLAALSHVLTAMSVEAFLGTDESFDSFVSQVRPHPGQVDSARSIHAFLQGSRLARHNDGTNNVLRQDRYSLRTASQWIGPVLEDFCLAYDQLKTEVNSVTDNPLVDAAGSRILHGGNFQAKSVTSAAEKLRQGLQSLGRLHFEQCKDLFNPDTNRGLPPNLVVDEPSGSYLWKGVDILTAAAATELGFLSGNVASHVMTAELGNQGVNSVALISARYTLTAVECLSQLAAAHLLVLCQALDLRMMWEDFLIEWRPSFDQLFSKAFGAIALEESEKEALLLRLWKCFHHAVDHNRRKDSRELFSSAATAMLPLILDDMSPLAAAWPEMASQIAAAQQFIRDCGADACSRFCEIRTSYKHRTPDVSQYLGGAAQRMYIYVRRDLRIPFLNEDKVAAKPEPVTAPDRHDEAKSTTTPTKGYPGTLLPDMSPTVGSYLTAVYEAIRNGQLYDQVAECFKEIEQNDHVQKKGVH